MALSVTVPHPVVLIVEDDSDTRSVLAELLCDYGYDTLTAAEGAGALEIVSSPRRIDVVLLDIVMPIMDGWEFASRLPQVEGRQDTPVIALSATRAPPRLEPPFVAFLQKPPTLGALFSELDRVLGWQASPST